MADDIAITAGSGTTVHTNEESIGSVSGHVQRVRDTGSTDFDPERLAPTTAATSASVAAKDTRKRIVFINRGTMEVYVSERATNAGTPASTTAHSIGVEIGASLELQTKAALYVFTGSGTGDVHYFEEFDS